MPESSNTNGPPARRRAERRRRALDNQALRQEFQLERPRGLVARLRAYAASVEDLERARVHASLWVGRPRPVPVSEVDAARAASPSKALDPRS
jgi:hypothetical protein